MTEKVAIAREELEQAHARLEQAKEEVQEAIALALAETRNAVDRIISESGFARGAVLGLEPAQKTAAKTEAKAWALISDPSKVYSGGRMPNWMAQAMKDKMYNPDSPDERRSFRKDHMKEI